MNWWARGGILTLSLLAWFFLLVGLVSLFYAVCDVSGTVVRLSPLPIQSKPVGSYSASERWEEN